MLYPMSRHIPKTSHVLEFRYFLFKKKHSITFQKPVSQLKERNQILKKTVSNLKMIVNARFTHFVPEKGQIQRF